MNTRAFVKSVFFGALAGAALPLMTTISIAVSSFSEGIHDGRQLLWAVFFAFTPLAVTFFVVFTASIVVGLPLTVLLKRRHQERASAYIGTGAAAGFVIPIAIYHLQTGVDSGGLFLATLGSLSGAVTGGTWWLSARKQRSNLLN